MGIENVVLERRVIPEGSLIMKEGDAGNCAYLIQSGSVTITTTHKGKEVELATLGLGEIFGEMALIFDEPRTASVVAREECSLIIITREILQQKVDRSDPAVKSIISMLTKRIISANNIIVNQGDNINDLMQTPRIIYQNILKTLDEEHQVEFQDKILPKMEEFLDALRDFAEK